MKPLPPNILRAHKIIRRILAAIFLACLLPLAYAVAFHSPTKCPECAKNVPAWDDSRRTPEPTPQTHPMAAVNYHDCSFDNSNCDGEPDNCLYDPDEDCELARGTPLYANGRVF